MAHGPTGETILILLLSKQRCLILLNFLIL